LAIPLASAIFFIPGVNFVSCVDLKCWVVKNPGISPGTTAQLGAHPKGTDILINIEFFTVHIPIPRFIVTENDRPV
jgi:hypothetical protein